MTAKQVLPTAASRTHPLPFPLLPRPPCTPPGRITRSTGLIIQPPASPARHPRGDTMRNMSFSATTQQMRNRTKTVTRRMGWRSLSPGELLCAVEKGQGLKKGEKVRRIGVIQVTALGRERLDSITYEGVGREGYPGKSPAWFVQKFCAMNGCKPDDRVTVVQFAHTDALVS